MDEKTKDALVKASQMLVVNNWYFMGRAVAAIDRLEKAETDAETADAGRRFFFWFEQVEEERKKADAVFMRELGRLWEFE